MLYESPDLSQRLLNPTAAELSTVLRDSPYEYWLRGGSGEAVLRDEGGLILSISQPEPGWFFFVLLKNWLVPYDGTPCHDLVKGEFGGNSFWIPRACLVEVDPAVEIASHFAAHRVPWPGVKWQFWDKLPLPDDYPHEP